VTNFRYTFRNAMIGTSSLGTDLTERPGHVGRQVVVRRHGRRGQSAYDGQATGRQRRHLLGEYCPEPPLDAVPQHSPTDGLAHHETDPGRFARVRSHQLVDHERASACAPPGSDGAAEVVGPAEPVRRWQHGSVTVVDGRPRRRQAARR
jgi:hypothetical protein